MVMTRLVVLGIATALLARAASGQGSEQPATLQSMTSERETKYLAFQIFTYYSSDPKVAQHLNSGSRERLTPGTAALRDYVLDIKHRIGVVGSRQVRLAVMLGPICFEQTEAESIEFVERAFDLALETDVAVGFHIDDSIFWSVRNDLWSDPANVEALDWDGTPSTGRRLDWSKNPSEAPPQMCFNSKAIQREVRQRSALLGKAIQAGVKRLQASKKPELFAGVIAGWETMIGQDFKTGKSLGYRALLNRGFSGEHPPKDMDLEREKVVQEFIELWTTGLADAGVSEEKIYSHTAFLSRRAFNAGDDKSITYMKKDKDAAYSHHNHFAPPSVAFGKHHRPGFSTYPQPGLFDDIYEQLTEHKQMGWASCEGTNMQPSSGPGQTGMNMETYLAKTFNHGGTLVNIFAWGVGGEAMKTMDFRVVTEGEDAIRAYRKFLKGDTLVEAKETSTLMERLPPKMHKIQKELPIWLQKADADNKAKATALMQRLQEHYQAKKFDEVEKSADAILKFIGASPETAARDIAEEARRKLRHEFGGAFLVTRDKVQAELKLTAEQREKLEQRLRELIPEFMSSLQKIEKMKPEDREKAFGLDRQKAQEKLAEVLKATLDNAQRKRLRELVLRREGLFGDEQALSDLKVTVVQRMRFMAETQQIQKKIAPLMEEAQKRGNPDEIRPKVLKLRDDLQGKLEGLLTEDQKKLWKEMRGKPVDVSLLFDDVSAQ
jgi:hypothetical protein